MADYKRMVSYMYQYDKGLKRKNVGYARVESRNGECKITLHLQLLGQSDSIFPTYLIQRDEKGMELIYLGDSVLVNQVMDSKLFAEEANIKGSGYGLSDIGGILIFLNEDTFFATEWDDKPIIQEEVMKALEPKKEEDLGQEDKESTVASKAEGEIVEVQGDSVEEVEMEFTYIDENITKQEEIKVYAEVDYAKIKEAQSLYFKVEKEETKEVNQYDEVGYAELKDSQNLYVKVEKEEAKEVNQYDELMYVELNNVDNMQLQINMDEESLQVVGEEIQYAEVERAIVKEQEQEGLFAKSLPTWNDTIEIKLPEADNIVKIMKPEKKKARYKMPCFIIVSSHKSKIQSIELDAGKDLDKVEEEIKNWENYKEAIQSINKQSINNGCEKSVKEEEHPLASRIFDNYPRMYPFEDSEVMICVKIEPKDIGFLPMEAWVLSNNSFLLHGYYCYNHLIFAKIKNRSGCRYILGVPGIYHNRERFMAKMFGFEHFKSIRKRELRQGDFGYWYIPINV